MKAVKALFFYVFYSVKSVTSSSYACHSETSVSPNFEPKLVVSPCTNLDYGPACDIFQLEAARVVVRAQP